MSDRRDDTRKYCLFQIMSETSSQAEELSEEDSRKRNYIEHSKLLPHSVLDPPHQDISCHLTAAETVAA